MCEGGGKRLWGRRTNGPLWDWSGRAAAGLGSAVWFVLEAHRPCGQRHSATPRRRSPPHALGDCGPSAEAKYPPLTCQCPSCAMISGARYSGVPHSVLVRAPGRTFLANPKSAIWAGGGGEGSGWLGQRLGCHWGAAGFERNVQNVLGADCGEGAAQAGVDWRFAPQPLLSPPVPGAANPPLTFT